MLPGVFMRACGETKVIGRKFSMSCRKKRRARGRRLARQVGLAFIVLVAMNVVARSRLHRAPREQESESAITGRTGAQSTSRNLSENAASTPAPPPLGFGGLQLND